MAKELTSEYPALRASLFQKVNLPEEFMPATLSKDGINLASLQVSRHGLFLSYRITCGGVSSGVNDRVAFDWTFPTYGGRRIWFRCPRCGRRCGVLYLGQRVVCRKCLDLAYPCEMDRFIKGWALHGRWLSRIDGGKPKRMRWSTYGRLREKTDARAIRKTLPLIECFRRKGYT